MFSKVLRRYRKVVLHTIDVDYKAVL